VKSNGAGNGAKAMKPRELPMPQLSKMMSTLRSLLSCLRVLCDAEQQAAGSHSACSLAAVPFSYGMAL
jgi:hypothetical protein